MTTKTAGRLDLEDRFRTRLPELSLDWRPAVPPRPELVAFNESLAEELRAEVDWFQSEEGVATLAGATVAPGSEPIAMAYAGHQFGGYSPRLGDGRAVLLGELTTRGGDLVDLHLKGSGRSPFARGGDGKASLGPMLREFLMAEAMHALGVPTARALSVVVTGESVLRDRPEPGAVLARVAASHLRVGTFEYAARLGADTLMPRLIDEAIDRHHRAVADSGNRAVALLRSVVEAQAELIARWMLVGFVHGVMNTDNMTISGQTIDYGPCAFIDGYNPAAVFSSIDHRGRYAYGNQPAIAQWDLARLAETLLPQIDADADRAAALATHELESFPERYRSHFIRLLAAKLGIEAAPADIVETLGDDLLTHMAAEGADFTSTFRALSLALRGDEAPLVGLIGANSAGRWLPRWRAAIADIGRPDVEVAAAMDAVNPLYIPRNHLVDEALRAATDADLAPFQRLLAIVTSPYAELPDAERFAEPASAAFTANFQTFCGT
ncbi:YdiU family protein [soil metagenome]